MLTHDEAELYDRQIRLWGVNAQSKIRQSKVLMLGFNGIASEVAKILVLAGIDTLDIVDDLEIQESDINSNLFCRPAQDSETKEKFRTHAVINKLKRLNPLVNVSIENLPIASKKQEDYQGYDLVTLHSFLPIDEITSINRICRLSDIKFYFVIDYGFYGFMFNDLGKEFKFTYEEYGDVVKQNDNELRQSGEAKDPISVGDDEDIKSLESDGDEDCRPIKKRRIHSPDKGSPEKVDQGEKVNKVGSLPYSTFEEMISLKEIVFGKNTSFILFLSIALVKFFTEKKRLPKFDKFKIINEDSDKLLEIIDNMKKTLKLDERIFKNIGEAINNIDGSLSPVCAVLGGVAGQDMIRALSNKDIPINNTFSFDGLRINGTIEKVGIKIDHKCLQMQPIVRDFLQIDDDDDDDDVDDQ